MLIKTVPFKHIYMKIAAEDVLKIDVPKLPTGYHYRFFQAGDAKQWAALERAVGEFDTLEEAQARYTSEFTEEGAHFKKIAQAFGIGIAAVKERQVFIENPQGKVVATATAWIGIKDEKYQPMLHWVSVDPTCQGLGLGRAIVSKAMSLFPHLDPGKSVMLHTQTWSYPAVVLYHKLGFYLCKTEGFRADNDFYHDLETVLKEVIPEPTFSKLMSEAK
ncbi:GNAT family N-acetyltransferase [Enterococcus sp. LJL98]